MVSNAPQAALRDRDVLGFTDSTAGPVVINRLLRCQALFAGKFLALNEGPQVLVCLDGHRLSIAVHVNNLGKIVPFAEFSVRVRRQNALEENFLDLPGRF